MHNMNLVELTPRMGPASGLVDMFAIEMMKAA
jgi:hypothetical protein